MKGVNKSILQKEGLDISFGKYGCIEDLAPRDALIIKMLRSPYAFARIKKINIEKAEKLEGVKYVFIFDEYVRYIGDEVAAVAAEREDIALDALSLIEVDYEVLEPVLDYEKAIDNPSVIHPEKEAHEMFLTGYKPQRNIAAEYHMSFGNMEEALSQCEYVVTERYYTQAQNHSAMEPHTSISYLNPHGRLNLVSSTQTSLHGEFITALVSLRTGRPAKLLYTREEAFEASYTRHPMRIDVTIGADRDANIKVIDMKILSNTGAYGEYAMTVFMEAVFNTLSLYNKAEAVSFEGNTVYTNTTPAGEFSGYGAIQCNFALESTIDILAENIGIDPMEFRAKNMMKEGESFPVFKIMGEGTGRVDMVMESCKLDYCIRRAMELSGWKDKYMRRQQNGKKIKGSGGAIAMQGSPPSFIAGFAEVEIDMDTGKIELLDYTAVVDCGAAIEPNLALTQVEGALVKSIGMTLYEDVKVSEKGKLLTNNFMQYKIPTRKEINRLTVEFAESCKPLEAQGAKSLGDISIATPPAAIANAVYNAIGVRFTKLPITPENVLMTLKRMFL